MSLKDVTDWASYLGPSSPLPANIVFDIRETVMQEDGSTREVSRRIQAHKQLLAAANSVFRSFFYGRAGFVGDTVVVRGTTVDAFSSLVRFIYDDPDYMSPTDDRQ